MKVTMNRLPAYVRSSPMRFLMLAAMVGQIPRSGAEYFDLRLEEALVSENPKTREWVLCPRIRFTLVDGKAMLPVIELKRGWVRSVRYWERFVHHFVVGLVLYLLIIV